MAEAPEIVDEPATVKQKAKLEAILKSLELRRQELAVVPAVTTKGFVDLPEMATPKASFKYALDTDETQPMPEPNIPDASTSACPAAAREDAAPTLDVAVLQRK